jgi:hypothetical protein
VEGCSFKDVFYFTTDDSYIYSFDGTTVTQITIATTGIAANSKTRGICVFDGVLLVGYSDGADNKAKIAKFTGSAWTAVVRNLTADMTVTSDETPARAYVDTLTPFQGHVHAACHVTFMHMMRHPSGSLNTAWEEIPIGVAGAPYQAVVY